MSFSRPKRLFIKLFSKKKFNHAVIYLAFFAIVPMAFLGPIVRPAALLLINTVSILIEILLNSRRIQKASQSKASPEKLSILENKKSQLIKKLVTHLCISVTALLLGFLLGDYNSIDRKIFTTPFLGPFLLLGYSCLIAINWLPYFCAREILEAALSELFLETIHPWAKAQLEKVEKVELDDMIKNYNSNHPGEQIKPCDFKEFLLRAHPDKRQSTTESENDQTTNDTLYRTIKHSEDRLSALKRVQIESLANATATETRPSSLLFMQPPTTPIPTSAQGLAWEMD